jgi:RNA polymerase sigma-70 factor, ECF subfamily
MSEALDASSLAAVHAEAADFAATDWPQIAGVYAEPARLDPWSPSTARSPSVSPTAFRPGWRCATGWTRTRGRPVAGRCTPPGPTCSAAPGIGAGAAAAYDRAVGLTANPAERTAPARRRAELGGAG